MDTSIDPHISAVFEPETAMALTLRYLENREEVAYQYAHTLVSTLAADLGTQDALRLTRSIIAETTNDIRDLEGEEMSSRIDVALRRLIDRVEAEPTD